jgi:hypothetical protein
MQNFNGDSPDDIVEATSAADIERERFDARASIPPAPDIGVKGESVYLNQSRLRDFLACEEYYHLGYEYQGGLTPKATELALSTGSAYHEGVSHYYHHDRDTDGGVEVAKTYHNDKRTSASLMPDERPLWDTDLVILELLLRSYDRKYHNEPLQVLMPEATGTVRLGNSPHYLVFRTDAVYQEYGTIGLLEYKTKKRTPSSLEIARIHSDIQPTAYIYGVRAATGLQVQGVKFRWAIKNPKLELNAIQLEEFTSRTKLDLKRFEDEAIHVCDRILENRKSGMWLHNWNQCTTFGECRMRRSCLHHRDPAVISLFTPRKRDYVDEAGGKPIA